MPIEEEIRPGIEGAGDRFAGPGQSRTERTGTIAAVAAGALWGDRLFATLRTSPCHAEVATLPRLKRAIWRRKLPRQTPHGRVCVKRADRPATRSHSAGDLDPLLAMLDHAVEEGSVTLHNGTLVRSASTVEDALAWARSLSQWGSAVLSG